MMGNQTPSVAVAKGERLTDERDQGGERGESTQRLSRSEGDTIENNDNERELGVGVRWRGGKGGGGGRYALSYISPKGNFHPTHKGRQQGRVVLRKVWIVRRVCVSMHMCSSLCKLADFVVGW